MQCSFCLTLRICPLGKEGQMANVWQERQANEDEQFSEKVVTQSLEKNSPHRLRLINQFTRTVRSVEEGSYPITCNFSAK
jgi:uncharacterized protein YciW